MSERKPYVRPVRPHWWARSPYRGYTLRELSGVGVACYGAVLLYALFALSRGAEAFAGFTTWLASPAGLTLHGVLLAVMLFHTVTWFETLPKTMPKLMVGGKPVAKGLITRIAILVALACSSVLVTGALL